METWTEPIPPAASRRTPLPRWKKLTASLIVVASLAGAIALGCHKYYSRTHVQLWTNDDGTRYVDTYRIWDNRHLHRYVVVSDETGNPTLIDEGPMSESSRPHGKWTHINVPLDSTTAHWYWYGEAITEGEWHLRNK